MVEGNIFWVNYWDLRSWYGAKFKLWPFSVTINLYFKILIEEVMDILEIPFEEMAIMKMGTFS